MSNIPLKGFNELSISQLFDLQTSIIKRLEKLSKHQQINIIQHYSGCFTLPELSAQAPNYLKRNLPKWLEKNQKFVSYDLEFGRVYISSGGYYSFIRKFYQFIKGTDGKPLELLSIVKLIADDTEWKF